MRGRLCLRSQTIGFLSSLNLPDLINFAPAICGYSAEPSFPPAKACPKSNIYARMAV